MAPTVTTGDWTMNKDSLAKGMLIRRPGLKEALEVIDVKSGQAKVKRSDGKNTTISAKAEVLYRWPEKAKKEAEARGDVVAEPKPKSISKPSTSKTLTSKRSKQDSQPSTLKPGDRILMSGDIYQVLRITDLNVRIKNEDNGALTSIPIDFDDYEMVLDKKGDEKSRSKGEAKEPKSISKAREAEQMEIGEEEMGGEIETEEEGEIPDDVREEIEKAFRSEDENQETEAEEETNTQEEENNMASEPSEWLTVQELSSEVGMSVVKINQLRKDKEIPSKFYKSDPDDQRRIIYHRDLIEKLGNRTPARRGRKPGSVKGREEDTGKQPSRRPETEARPSRQIAPPSSTAISGSLDTYLSKAIESAEGQIAQLQDLVETLKGQREALQVWG